MDALTCLLAVWLNFPPIGQMLDRLTSDPPSSAALATPYALQTFLWGMRLVTQGHAIRVKISNESWRSTDPAEAHNALIGCCLRGLRAASTAETLADHKCMWNSIAEIFPSRRIVLPLGMSGDGDDLQQLIDNNSHMIPTGTPKLQILELGRRGYDEEKRAWYKNCHSVTIPDRVTIDSTHYVLYALITHTGDFRSQKYYPYVRPEGVGKQWTYYHKNVSSKVDHQRATVLNQGNGGIKHQSGPVEMHTNEVAYMLYYAREDVFAYDAGAMEKGPSAAEPRALPDWIARVEATPGQTITAAVSASGAEDHQPDPDEDDENDSDEGDDDDNESDEDGDETMEDRAEDEEGSHFKLIEKGSTYITRDYIGSDYYQGEAVHSRPHGIGTLISIATGDKYHGSFENGVKSGHGKMIFANGDVYDGTWVSDQQNGQGTFTEALTGNVYTGGWKDGRQHGRGTTHWQKAQDEQRGCCICWSADVQIVFIRCGHICACEACAARVDRCPVCREVVRGRQKFYFTG